MKSTSLHFVFKFCMSIVRNRVGNLRIYADEKTDFSEKGLVLKRVKGQAQVPNINVNVIEKYRIILETKGIYNFNKRQET